MMPVMAQANFTHNEFEDVPYLRQRHDWAILTPPLPKDSKMKLFLDRHGCQISTGQGKIFRERGWWLSGQDKLASFFTKLESWVAILQNLDAKLPSVLKGALQCTAPNDPPFFDDSTLARPCRNGTELGLLGLHFSAHDIYAKDGSLEGGRMGAGLYILTSGMKSPTRRVGRSRGTRTSLRVETGASYLALEHGKDIRVSELS